MSRSRSRSRYIYFSNASPAEGTWTTNPKPSFTQHPSADPTKGTGINVCVMSFGDDEVLCSFVFILLLIKNCVLYSEKVVLYSCQIFKGSWGLLVALGVLCLITLNKGRIVTTRLSDTYTWTEGNGAVPCVLCVLCVVNSCHVTKKVDMSWSRFPRDQVTVTVTGHGVFILATSSKGKWTTNPTPSFHPVSQRRPYRGTGIGHGHGHGHGVFISEARSPSADSEDPQESWRGPTVLNSGFADGGAILVHALATWRSPLQLNVLAECSLIVREKHGMIAKNACVWESLGHVS